MASLTLISQGLETWGTGRARAEGGDRQGQRDFQHKSLKTMAEFAPTLPSPRPLRLLLSR